MDEILEAIKIFFREFGWYGLLRLLIYPFTTLITTPFRLIQSLRNCRILADGKEWGYYSGFTVAKSFTALFYYTRALNLYRFGRMGVSPYIGLGNNPLSRFFFYSLPSLYVTWRNGVLAILFGMAGWLVLHFIWIQSTDYLWVVITTCLAFISTTFYANCFKHQNYNALGWLFFPIILYGLFTKHWTALAIGCLFASFFSITIVFLTNIFSLLAAISCGSIIPLIAILPANLKLILNFYPLFNSGDFISRILNVTNAVGITKKQVKYKRTSSKSFGLYQQYFLILYLQFIFCYWLITEDISIIYTAGILIFIINAILFRFADIQSMQMLMFSLSTAVIISNPDFRLLPSYWLVISPIPILTYGYRIEKFLDMVPLAKPVSVKKYLEAMKVFFKNVTPNQRILMAYDDPKEIYENIFDGYRIIYEVPLHVASKLKIHLMPDWWAVMELNYEGAPDFWGRDVNSVLKNLKYWQAGFVIIYQKTGSQLDAKWLENGFELVAKFSWAQFEDLFRDGKPFKGDTPDWWLLKRPDNL